MFLMNRRLVFRFIAASLLLFGFAFEVSHMQHHLEHARHQHDDGHDTHQDCLVFHSGALAVDAIDLSLETQISLLFMDTGYTRPAAKACRLLPEPRAPPVSL
jgi:hypothetical protein